MGKLGPILYIFVLIGISLSSNADDNHVHVEQVNGGDNLELQIDQIGYDNLIPQAIAALYIPKFTKYRTRAIITHGLYTFYLLFEVHLCTVTFGLMYG